MKTRTWIVVAMCLAVASPAWAAPRCKKGIPCGNTCISASRTCHIGREAPSTTKSTDSLSTPAVAPAESAASAAAAATAVAATAAAAPLAASALSSSEPDLWVGSIADTVYFRASCSAARDLAVANKRDFTSEAEAQQAGFRRSSTPGC